MSLWVGSCTTAEAIEPVNPIAVICAKVVLVYEGKGILVEGMIIFPFWKFGATSI